jgi:hypothetical protein
MSFRIDEAAKSRTVDDSGRTAGLSQEDHAKFQAEINEALQKRSEAGGRESINDVDERLAVVEKGDNLTKVAAENRVTLDQLLAHNPHLRGTAGDHIVTDDVVFLPNTSPSIAANTPRNAQGIPQGEEGFATNLYEQGNDLEYADNPGAIDHAAETAGIADDVQGYLQALPADQRQAAAQRLFDRDWRDAGPAQEAIEQAAGRMGLQLEPTTHSGPAIDDPVRDIIAGAQSKNGAVEQLKALNAGYANASPEVRNVLLRSQGAREIVTNAANWANEPLGQDPTRDVNPQVPGRESAERLNQLTAQIDPRLGVDLVNAAAPGWERFNQHYQENLGSSMLGMQGMRELMAVSDRIYTAEGGQQAVARFAEMGHYDRNGIYGALSEGIGPAYALEFVRAHAADIDVGTEIQQITAGMESYANGIKPRATELAQHNEELNWLIENHRSSMTPEQLDDAIKGYIRSHPEWQAESDRLEQALADGGAKLLNNWNQIRAFASDMPADPNLAGHRDALLSSTAETAATPEITAATTAALRTRPELFQATAGVSTLDTIDMLQSASNNARAANAIRKLGQEAVTFYMKHRIEDFVRADVSTPAKADMARANLLQGMREGVIARIMGVSDKHYQMAVDALETAIPRAGESEPQKLQRLKDFNSKLDTIYQTDDGVKSFSRFTPPGQIMRVAGLALSGTTAVFSVTRAFDDPTLANGFKAAVDAVGMTQKFADFALGLRGEDTTGWLKTVGGTPVTRLFGALTAAADVGIAVQYIMRGDPGAAAWTGVTAAGGFTWALGTSAWSGPVGFGLTLIGVLGLEAHRRHQESTKYETQTSADFLAHSGLSREAADALKDQSGEGYSPVPILMRYGELRGLNPQQTVDWINSIARSEDGTAKLGALRDNLHHTLDEIDGDASRFNATAENDDQRIWDTEQRPWFARTGVARPESAAQLDVMLPILEIPKPNGAVG